MHKTIKGTSIDPNFINVDAEVYTVPGKVVIAIEQTEKQLWPLAEAVELRDALNEAIEELTPKEPTTWEKLEELPIGSIIALIRRDGSEENFVWFKKADSHWATVTYDGPLSEVTANRYTFRIVFVGRGH